MADALIGYSGFVGSNLLRQRAFDATYNSKNIDDIAGREFDLLVCAGAPAAKWLANSKPEEDAANLNRLQARLRQCRANRVILISTIDVYAKPVGVDESTAIDPDQVQPYGKHRYELERFVTEHFPRAHILRLPALFGPGLKKNFVYDLLNSNCLDWTHKDSRFQFYDVSRLWNDCELVLERGFPVLNLATPPIAAGRMAADCFGIEFLNETATGPVNYDMHTRHGDAFGLPGPYIVSETDGLQALKRYVEMARSGSP
jgi:nucleoside-diphosphate-sugar epimerase